MTAGQSDGHSDVLEADDALLDSLETKEGFADLPAAAVDGKLQLLERDGAAEEVWTLESGQEKPEILANGFSNEEVDVALEHAVEKQLQHLQALAIRPDGFKSIPVLVGEIFHCHQSLELLGTSQENSHLF